MPASRSISPHCRKVEISTRISARPETPVWLHRLQLLAEGPGWRKPPGERPPGNPAPTPTDGGPAT
jgi:hypothetical protein